MQRGGPRCKKPFLLSFVRPTCKKAGRHAGLAARDAKKKFWISDGQPCMSALLFYCFTILLFYCFTISLQVQYCRGRCLGLAARDAKKFSTYHHVLQQNVVFASRTANLACRPSYSIFLLIYYFSFSLHARDAKKRFCISDGQPCMSALLFYCFTNLLFFYFAPDTVLPRPMFGVDHPRCKKIFHVLQQNVVFASRTANLACRPSYSTVLLFYYLLFHSRYSTAAADVWGWPPEMQKVFHVLPRTTTYCHVLQQNVGLHLGQPTLHVGPPILFFLLI